jgi:hypothetical protein
MTTLSGFFRSKAEEAVFCILGHRNSTDLPTNLVPQSRLADHGQKIGFSLLLSPLLM